jgi:hypothetical protein
MDKKISCSHKVTELHYQITVLRFSEKNFTVNTILLLFLLLLECDMNRVLQLLFFVSYIGYC